VEGATHGKQASASRWPLQRQLGQRLRFVYRGCGRVAVTDLAFPTFTYGLQQVPSMAGVEPCRPSGEILGRAPAPAQPLAIHSPR